MLRPHLPDTHVFFKENKRLKSADDKGTLKELKRDIFNLAIPVEATIRKRFEMVKDWQTIYNIAYRNATCSIVSKEVWSKILKETTKSETVSYAEAT